MDDTQFKPFVPPEPMFEDQPAHPPAADKDKPNGSPRKTRPPKADKKPTRLRRLPVKNKRPPVADKPKMPPAPKHVRPKRKPRAVTAPPKKKRKARVTVYAVKAGKIVGKTRALKLDLTSAMAISSLLKPADFKMFESLTAVFQIANKATRRRMLAAIGKVFG